MHIMPSETECTLHSLFKGFVSRPWLLIVTGSQQTQEGKKHFKILKQELQQELSAKDTRELTGSRREGLSGLWSC